MGWNVLCFWVTFKTWDISVALNFRNRLNAYFEKESMGGQRLKSVNYLIALEMFSICENKRSNGSVLKQTRWKVIISLFLSYSEKNTFQQSCNEKP